MCCDLGPAAAAASAPEPEPEPEPEPPGPAAWPAPPPPRARPALDAVSAAARLPPEPPRSPAQAEPSPAGSGRGGQGARGRRSVWSQRARRRTPRGKEGKPPPPPRSGRLSTRAPLAAAEPTAPGPHAGPGRKGLVRERLRGRGSRVQQPRGPWAPAPGKAGAGAGSRALPGAAAPRPSAPTRGALVAARWLRGPWVPPLPPGSRAGAPEVSGRRAPAGQTSLPDAAAQRAGTLDPSG